MLSSSRKETSANQADYLWLNRFPFEAPDFRVLSYLGSGSAGYVFKVRLKGQIYALKMFKFFQPNLCRSKLKGMAKQIYYDSFVRECRANSRLVKEKINGLHSPFCHGWVEVPSKTEIDVARRFNIQPFLWGRNLDMENQLVRGIIFDYFEGVSIVNIPLTIELIHVIRAGLRAIHATLTAHGDIRASNILSDGISIKWIDFSASLTTPHTTLWDDQLKLKQDLECKDLERGFALMSKLSINQAFRPATSDIPPIDKVFACMRHRWSPSSSLSPGHALEETSTQGREMPLAKRRKNTAQPIPQSMLAHPKNAIEN